MNSVTTATVSLGAVTIGLGSWPGTSRSGGAVAGRVLDPVAEEAGTRRP